MAEREDIDWKLADGLAGYFQFVNSTSLLAMPGEDTAQFVMCQVLQSLQRYRVEVSVKPAEDWDGKRVDAALLAKSEGAETVYAVAEVKWIADTEQRQNARPKLLKDCARLASIDLPVTSLRAKFLVVGFIDGMRAGVFDTSHPDSASAERQRVVLGELLSRTVGSGPCRKSHADLTAADCFPEYQARVPEDLRWSDRGLEVELLAYTPIKNGLSVVGDVFVW